MSGIQWYDRSASNELDGRVGDLALRSLGEDESTQGSPMPAGLSRMLKDGANRAMPIGVPIGFAVPGVADDGDDDIDRGIPTGLAPLVASTRHTLQISSTGSKALSAALDVTPANGRSMSATTWTASNQPKSSGQRLLEMTQAVAPEPSVSQAEGDISRRGAYVPLSTLGRMSADEPHEPLGSARGPALSAAVGAAAARDALSGVAVGEEGPGAGATGGNAISAVQAEAAGVGASRSTPVSLSGVPLSGSGPLLAVQGDGLGNGDSASVGRWVDSGAAGVDVVPRRISAGQGRSAETSSIGLDAPSAPPATATRVWSGNEQGGSDLASSRQASQELNAGSMVALRGDVLMDGRKMGRIVAAGQTSAASLPGVSSSAVNLRAMPVFSGTSVPL